MIHEFVNGQTLAKIFLPERQKVYFLRVIGKSYF
ncbi:hypothetical protein SAMN05444359_12565 [Neolewinella agarilytica]|uniref:Uncharacterized protein n=1 Tax=Neolewinella agarilytica TaxID=478744 RepID=A0A1H9LTW1_9BACT|nr:hypothetical protein SAMN05444359_12565 [Neolewinella agarilytica]